MWGWGDLIGDLSRSVQLVAALEGLGLEHSVPDVQGEREKRKGADAEGSAVGGGALAWKAAARALAWKAAARALWQYGLRQFRHLSSFQSSILSQSKESQSHSYLSLQNRQLVS